MPIAHYRYIYLQERITIPIESVPFVAQLCIIIQHIIDTTMRHHLFLTFLTILLAAFTGEVKAQKDYKPGLLLLLQYADHDFKSIVGAKMSEEPELEAANYQPLEKIGIGSEKIIKANTSEMAFYTCTVSLLESHKLIADALELANDQVKKGLFTGDDLSDGKGKTVTVLKNKEGHEVMKLISQYIKDDDDDNDFFAIVIYGRSIRMKMAE
ncbi:MAG: hypothetical protein J7527_06140 [Chitinophagaceae bacterium]|nr:hypothetical protein [Chitinophagaceae bacterium]